MSAALATGERALALVKEAAFNKLIEKIKAGERLALENLRLTVRDRSDSAITDQTFLPGMFDADGLNAFHWACKAGQSHQVNFLLTQYPGLINVPTTSGVRPLQLAIESGKSEIALSLLANRELGKIGEYQVSFQRAFFAALQQEAISLVKNPAVVNEFFAMAERDRNLDRILGTGTYVIDDPKFLEGISQARLNQFLNLLVRYQAIDMRFNLDIRIERPKAIHKEKVLRAMASITDLVKKEALENLVYKLGRPTPVVKGVYSFDVFLWKKRWFRGCRRESGSLKKLSEQAPRLVSKPAIAFGGPGVGGAGFGSSAGAPTGKCTEMAPIAGAGGPSPGRP